MTGQRIDARNSGWLEGPVGGAYMGDEWLPEYAESIAADVIEDQIGGLLESVASLDQAGFSGELAVHAHAMLTPQRKQEATIGCWK